MRSLCSRFLPLIFSGLLFLACSQKDSVRGTQDEAPSIGVTPINKAATLTNEAVTPTAILIASPTQSMETFSLDSFQALLSGLDSYRLEMSLEFNGVDDQGLPSTWTLHESRILATERQAYQFDLIVKDLVDLPELQAMSVVQIGENTFLSLPGIGCISGKGQATDYKSDGPVSPDGFLAGLSNARLISSSELVNDTLANHYTFNEQAIPALRDRSLAVDGHLYVTAETGIITNVSMRVDGQSDFLSIGREEEGALQLTIDLLDVNRQINIVPPAECRDTTRYPTVDDAHDLTSLEDLIGYRSRYSLEHIVSFYEEEMPVAGWIENEELVIFDDAAILTYKKDGTVVTIILEEDPDDDSIFVLITP
jgi:hypothetical protein